MERLRLIDREFKWCSLSARKCYSSNHLPSASYFVPRPTHQVLAVRLLNPSLRGGMAAIGTDDAMDGGVELTDGTTEICEADGLEHEEEDYEESDLRRSPRSKRKRTEEGGTDIETSFEGLYRRRYRTWNGLSNALKKYAKETEQILRVVSTKLIADPSPDDKKPFATNCGPDEDPIFSREWMLSSRGGVSTPTWSVKAVLRVIGGCVGVYVKGPVHQADAIRIPEADCGISGILQSLCTAQTQLGVHACTINQQRQDANAELVKKLEKVQDEQEETRKIILAEQELARGKLRLIRSAVDQNKSNIRIQRKQITELQQAEQSQGENQKLKVQIEDLTKQILELKQSRDRQEADIRRILDAVETAETIDDAPVKARDDMVKQVMSQFMTKLAKSCQN